MYDWGDALEGEEGRDPFVSCGFHCVGHGLGVCFFVMGESQIGTSLANRAKISLRSTFFVGNNYYLKNKPIGAAPGRRGFARSMMILCTNFYW